MSKYRAELIWGLRFIISLIGTYLMVPIYYLLGGTQTLFLLVMIFPTVLLIEYARLDFIARYR